MKSWLAVVKVITLLLPFSQWEFSVSVETGHLFFSKDVYSPSIYFGPHPLPSQVFHFVLVFSSFAILSPRSRIKLKIGRNRGLWTVYIHALVWIMHNVWSGMCVELKRSKNTALGSGGKNLSFLVSIASKHIIVDPGLIHIGLLRAH